MHNQSNYSGTVWFLQKAIRSLEQQEGAQLWYEHMFMFELKNDLGRISQRLVLRS